jgi:hypothetical protein
MTIWTVYSEWLPLSGSHSPDRMAMPHPDRAVAEQDALQLACCRGARYVSVQGPDDVVTFEWDRYTNVARRYGRKPDRAVTMGRAGPPHARRGP